jgi:hypothetical protein
MKKNLNTAIDERILATITILITVFASGYLGWRYYETICNLAMTGALWDSSFSMTAWLFFSFIGVSIGVLAWSFYVPIKALRARSVEDDDDDLSCAIDPQQLPLPEE